MFQMLTYYTVSIHYYLLPISSDKALNTGGRVLCVCVCGGVSVKLTTADTSFLKSCFLLEMWNFLLTTNTVHCFPWSVRLTGFILKQMSARSLDWRANVCQLFFQVKVMFHGKKKKKASLAHNSISPVLSLETTITLKYWRNASPLITQTVKKMCSQVGI